MEHANNAVWMDWIDEAVQAAAGVPDGPRRYVLEYLASATLGASLTATAWPAGDGVDVVIAHDGAPATYLMRARMEPIADPASLVEAWR